MILAELYFLARRALRCNSDAVMAATEAMRAKKMMENFIFDVCFPFDEMSWTWAPYIRCGNGTRSGARPSIHKKRTPEKNARRSSVYKSIYIHYLESVEIIAACFNL
jgi:hypothetical protein